VTWRAAQGRLTVVPSLTPPDTAYLPVANWIMHLMWVAKTRFITGLEQVPVAPWPLHQQVRRSLRR
jgi:hypothetical protein